MTKEEWTTPSHQRKLSEATPWDKLCIDLIGPYKINRKGKENSYNKQMCCYD